MRALIVTTSVGLLLLAGCQTVPPQMAYAPTYDQALNNAFTAVNYSAAAELLKRFPRAPSPVPVTANNTSKPTVVAVGAPFIVATIVSIDQLEESSSFGRLVSEQISSRMVELGQNVVELKIRSSIFMKQNEGEFLLTREIKEVANEHKAQAVVVGTYTVSSSLVFVNLKLVDPSNSAILATYDYAHPMNAQIKSMLQKPGNDQKLAIDSGFSQWQFERDMRRTNPDWRGY